MTCNCCGRKMMRVGRYDEFPEYECDECGYTRFFTPDRVTAADYEESAKYLEYYVGAPPRLWYHDRALKELQQRRIEGEVLDFGCYDGFFVRRLLDAGIPARGCDWNRAAIKWGKVHFDLEGRLAPEWNGKFEAVVALEVIEHFQNPDDFLKLVQDRIEPGGLLLLSCPNKEAIYRPRTDRPPHHFSRFTPSSLEAILSRHGFRVLKHERETSTFQLLRNGIGDALRREGVNLEREKTGGGNSRAVRFMKSLANAIAPLARQALRPVDLALRQMDLFYLSQFAVAQWGGPEEVRETRR